jgi:hypothetical protein
MKGGPAIGLPVAIRPQKWAKWVVVTLAKQDKGAHKHGKSANSPKRTGKPD